MPRSDILVPADIIGLWNAADFALELDKPLNTVITLVWQYVGITDQAKSDKMFSAFITKLRRWLMRHGGYHAVWVAENSPERGYHHHILVHIPQPQIAVLRGCIGSWMPRSRHPQRSHATDVRTHWRNANPVNAHRGMLRYACKATDYVADLVDRETGELVNLTSMLGIEPREGKALSGFVKGKRRGWSESLGAAAQSRSCFQSRFERFA